jgi:oxalate decarboxylase/phosphoglucose isomerase-like protein (cupin superfamily)
MTDGFVRGPGEGERVSPAMTLKVGDKNSQAWSMFEVVDIGPGFDVGAHLHRNAEELFYVLEGQLDLLAFEPRVRTLRATGRAGSRAPGPRWPAAGQAA